MGHNFLAVLFQNLLTQTPFETHEKISTSEYPDVSYIFNRVLKNKLIMSIAWDESSRMFIWVRVCVYVCMLDYVSEIYIYSQEVGGDSLHMQYW
jgi:hypothetical protein